MGEVIVATPSVLSLDAVLPTTTITPLPDLDLPPIAAPPPALPHLVADLPVPPSPSAPPLTLPSLPTELHLMIFSHLDQIDSTCLGLSSRKMYFVYRRLHHKTPLNARRLGRNTLEAAWRAPRPCRFCDKFRCELHMHIADFFPERYEYCHVRQVFGLRAKEGMEEFCYRHCPPQPQRCGRHRLPKGGNVEEVAKL